MKKVLALVIALVSFASVSMASDRSPVSYSFKASTDHKAAFLRLSNVSGEKVDYYISDEAGNLYLHKTIVDVKSANEVLNFSHLPAGEYVFTMEFADRRVIKMFNINDDRVAVMKGHKMVMKDKPFIFRLIDKKLDVLFDNSNDEEMALELTDENGNLVYADTFEASEIKKRFDLSRLNGGVYYLKLSGNKVKYEDTLDL
ncbi:T9SS type A sorting domain-containing protein [Sediminitomix flava]|uniref:Putative secreted protein (Por secretion system target) n=1 Tax=Sediminitomix flava TaxID=379075 RepID=A0A315ZB69_SEDFL|nr:T9SS type A sorting domain-containing protein [Sediminitomix flava]PWJ42791.1 putative secreted protein (Por secretion system target) [Sediminitomix flava]